MSLFTCTFPYAGLVDVHFKNISNDRQRLTTNLTRIVYFWPDLQITKTWRVLLTFGSIDVLYDSHPWCVVLMFSPIFLPRILHYIEFVYEQCYSRRLGIQVCVSGRLRFYCSITYEDLTFTRDFNMPVRVIVHVN